MLLELRDIWFSYPGGVEALRGAYLSVDRGEAVGVIGSNGSGKTTLLLVAAGLLKPSRGDVLLEGKSLFEQLPEARRRIGIVFQDPDDQLFNPTVFDEIAYALRQLGLEPEEISGRVEGIAEKLRITHLLGRQPHRLSLGEKKIVALGSILIYEPEVIILDEPTANMAPTYVTNIEDIIKQLRDNGRAIVVASQDIEFIARIADRVFVLREGKVMASGQARGILVDEELLTKANLDLPVSTKIYVEIFGRDENIPITLEELLSKLTSRRGERANRF